MSNNSRLSCKGLLRESLSSKKNIPSLVTICVNKLRTIRNSYMFGRKEFIKELNLFNIQRIYLL